MTGGDPRRHEASELAGRRLTIHADRTRSCSSVTVTALPAVPVPSDFTGDGLPVGPQLVGRYGGVAGLLALAETVVDATGAAERRPSASP